VGGALRIAHSGENRVGGAKRFSNAPALLGKGFVSQSRPANVASKTLGVCARRRAISTVSEQSRVRTERWQTIGTGLNCQRTSSSGNTGWCTGEHILSSG
jgi:hypothetical protein